MQKIYKNTVYRPRLSGCFWFLLVFVFVGPTRNWLHLLLVSPPSFHCLYKLTVWTSLYPVCVCVCAHMDVPLSMWACVCLVPSQPTMSLYSSKLQLSVSLCLLLPPCVLLLLTDSATTGPNGAYFFSTPTVNCASGCKYVAGVLKVFCVSMWSFFKICFHGQCVNSLWQN